MPVYEYRCLACGDVFSHLFQRYADATDREACPACGSDQTRRLISSFVVTGRAHPGPGRAAWPTSWDDTNGGDPETLRYWRHRIERDARLEEKYPELRDPSLLNGAGTASEVPEDHGHHHSHAHTHEHPHSHQHNAGDDRGSSGSIRTP